MADQTLNIFIRAKDEYSRVFGDLSRKMSGVQRGLQQFGQTATRAGRTLTAGLTLPIIGLGGFALKAAIDFESAFADVRKTVDATEAEFAILERGIRDMAKELPTSAKEIAGVAAAAGQLGIAQGDILGFTRVMVDLGETTNLAATDAATQLARLANITGLQADEFSNLGSSIVELGNNMATTEAEIVEMALRLAATGSVIGLTEAQILGFSAALSSIGINAQAGGSAFSTLFINLARSVASGSESLELFAKLAGTTVAEFSELFKRDAASAIQSFLEGLGRVEESGGNVFAVMEALGITEKRQIQAVLGLATAQGVLDDALGFSGRGFEENTALSEEAAKRYETTAAQLSILKNQLIDVAITFGQALLPALTDAIEHAQPLIDGLASMAEKFAALPAPVRTVIIVLALVVAALGPVLLMVGLMASGLATLIGIAPAVGAAMTIMLGPWGLVILAVAALVIGIVLLIKHWDALSSASVDAGRALGRGILDGTRIALQAIVRFNEAAHEFIQRLPGQFLTVGRDMMNAMARGIADGAGAVLGAAKGVIDSLIGIINPFNWQVGSTLVETYERAGKMSGEAIVGALLNAVGNVDAVGDELIKPLQRLRDFVKDLQGELGRLLGLPTVESTDEDLALTRLRIELLERQGAVEDAEARRATELGRLEEQLAAARAEGNDQLIASLEKKIARTKENQSAVEREAEAIQAQITVLERSAEMRRLETEVLKLRGVEADKTLLTDSQLVLAAEGIIDVIGRETGMIIAQVGVIQSQYLPALSRAQLEQEFLEEDAGNAAGAVDALTDALDDLNNIDLSNLTEEVTRELTLAERQMEAFLTNVLTLADRQMEAFFTAISATLTLAKRQLAAFFDPVPWPPPGVFPREHGGPVRAGQAVIVGERRPELFVPDVAGTILPSVPMLGRRGGGGGTVIYNLTANFTGPFMGDENDARMFTRLIMDKVERLQRGA